VIQDGVSQEESHEDEHHEDEHEHHDEAHHEDEHHEASHSHSHGGLDPHTWLSPKVMSELAGILAEKLMVQDTPEAQTFIAKLTALDTDFSTRLQNCSTTELVTSHEAFGYLARDYRLVQVPVSGIEPSAEPAASDVADIITLIKEKNIPTIFTESLVSPKFTDTIKAETGVQTLELHALETLTPEEARA
jgi:zinc transport system substrate-binding protein